MIKPEELELLRKDLTTYRATSTLWFYSGITMKKVMDYVDYLEKKLEGFNEKEK